MNSPTRAILIFSCPDQKGLVSMISGFIAQYGGNIISLHEHVDSFDKTFFLRVVWDMNGFDIPGNELDGAFNPVGKKFNANWSIRYTGRKLRIAVMVSKYEHCLQELLWRQRLPESAYEIPLIISNHHDLEPMAAYHQIPYHVFPITKENKDIQEQAQLKLLNETNIDAIVLARYMQVLSKSFVDHYPNRLINIHHSFLPAFMGGNPYKQAYERGVKIIGATSHYVTEDLDKGPIIDQDIIRISHRDSVNDLVRRGRDLERIVLARAVNYHAEHRILVNGKKTVVFQ
ncbi:MAG: formyltetrahydrofolate deformylase [Bacteroidales bacterium]|nr:formyltetrahydrofolate deformylase [Bacteroidales bacterium]